MHICHTWGSVTEGQINLLPHHLFPPGLTMHSEASGRPTGGHARLTEPLWPSESCKNNTSGCLQKPFLGEGGILWSWIAQGVGLQLLPFMCNYLLWNYLCTVPMCMLWISPTSCVYLFVCTVQLCCHALNRRQEDEMTCIFFRSEGISEHEQLFYILAWRQSISSGTWRH